MKCLITGGAGFIGSHLAEELVRQKHQIIVIDNLSTGTLKNLRFIRNKIQFIKCDISKSNKLPELFYGVDYVFHLAGLSKATESVKNPHKYYKNNMIGTSNILNLVRTLKLKKFIYSASASCYGNSKEIPTSETAKIHALSPYAVTKWMSEKMIMEQAKIYKFPAISLAEELISKKQEIVFLSDTRVKQIILHIVSTPTTC